MTGNTQSVHYSFPREEHLTAAVGVIVLDAQRVDFRAFCSGGGDCGPAVAESSAAVAALPGEQDPAAVLAAVRRCVDETVAAGGWVTGVRARMLAARVVSVAVVNRHGGSLLAWNRCTGAPLSNAILWSDEATNRGRGQQSVASDAGASAIKRLIDGDDAVRAAMQDGHCYFGTIDAWIVWNLTGGANGGVFATDPSAAFKSLTENSPPEWKAEPLAVLGVSPGSLPIIKAAHGLYGYFCDGPLRETPISGVVGYRQPSAESVTVTTNAVNVAKEKPLNALELLTASIRRSMEAASSARVMDIEGNHNGFTSKVQPSVRQNTTDVVPTTLTELCDARPRLEPVRTEIRVKDEEVVQSPASIPVADFPEVDPGANTSTAEGHDGDTRGAVDDDGIASEKPRDRKWTVGATVAAVGAGALLVFGGYKWLTHK